jgi:uncharacterized repeat protein (TIGR02543 family)
MSKKVSPSKTEKNKAKKKPPSKAEIRKAQKAKAEAAKKAKLARERAKREAERAKKKSLKAKEKRERLAKKYPPLPKRNTALTTFIAILIVLSLAFLTFNFLNPIAKVDFNTNGGSATASQLIFKGSTIERPVSPVRKGYVFDDWFADQELTVEFDFSKRISEYTVIYAKWSAFDYPINAELNGGDYSDGVKKLSTYTIEDEIILPSGGDLYKAGYTFGGWFTDIHLRSEYEIYAIYKGSTGSITIYAKWIPNDEAEPQGF